MGVKLVGSRVGSALPTARESHPTRWGTPHGRWNYAVLVALLLVVWSAHGSFRADGLRMIRDTWSGVGRPTEFVQDVIGARALASRADPYPILGQGAQELGLQWPIVHRSTHPPTAFLFALPLADLPWDVATAWWLVAMLALVGLTAVALDLPLTALPGTGLALVWPPAAWSLCQLTPIWLAGLVLAWRLQSRPVLAGVAIGVASLTKLLPALALAPFVWRRQWGAIVGFVAVWATAFGLLAVLGAPGAWTHYLSLMISVGREQAARTDNAALWLAAQTRWGGLGLVGTGTLVAAVLVQAVGRLRQGREIEFTVFGLWVWLTIAFLPIAWDYSLLPLLPWLVVLVWQGRPLAALLGGLALALPTVPWAEDNSLLITGALAAAGLALSWQVAGLSASLPRSAPRHMLADGSP